MDRRGFIGQLLGAGATAMASAGVVVPQTPVTGLYIVPEAVSVGDIIRHMDGRPIAVALQDGAAGQLIRVRLKG